jgi:hypothetical protein
LQLWDAFCTDIAPGAPFCARPAWIGRHTYSYLPNVTPALQLFLRATQHGQSIKEHRSLKQKNCNLIGFFQFTEFVILKSTEGQ